MGNELSLVFFTILAQIAIGLFIITQLATETSEKHKKSIYIYVVGITAASMLVSLTHLGDPFGAYRAIYHLGSSWLSREIFFIGIFFCCSALMYWKIRQDKQVHVSKLGWLGVFLGLAVIISMSNIYYFSSIPAWMSLYTYISFLSAMVILGSTFFILFVNFTDGKNLQVLRFIAISNSITFIVQLACFVPYLGYLNIHALLSAQYIMDHMQLWAVGQGLLFLSLCTTGIILKKHSSPQNITNKLTAGSFVLALLGVFIGRYLFYASGMPMW